MEDRRVLLPEGYVIYRNGTERIAVKSKIGAGGTSIVYDGYSYKNENNSEKRYVLIKEIYPYAFSISRDENGGLSVPHGRVKRYKKYIEEAKNEVEFYNEQAGGTDSARSDDYFTRSFFVSPEESENGNCYVIMDTVLGESLDSIIKRGKESFTSMCNYIVSLLESVERLHNLGKVHLDISPDNIYVSDKGVVRLIDFGSSAIYENDDGSREYYPSKKGYSAPEQLYGDKDEVDAKSDLYSVTACFFKMITGEIYLPDEEPVESAVKEALEKSELCKNVNPTAVWKAEKLLKKGLANKDERYETAEEMISDMTEIRKASEIKVFLSDNRMHITQPDHCFPRDEMVDKMHEVLTNPNKGNGHLYLSGIGGCGKSTLAYLYKQKYGHLYHTVHIADYADYRDVNKKEDVNNKEKTTGINLKSLVADMRFEGLEDNVYVDKETGNVNFERKLSDKLDLLRKADENTLIIIENYNVSGDSFCSDFLKNTKFRVLFNTRGLREERIGVDYLKAEDVNENDAYSFFNSIYNNPSEKETVIQIIEKTGRNFLAMKLVALVLENYRGEISTQTVLDKLRNSKPFEEEIDVDEKIEVSPECVLKEVFDISNLGEADCDILSKMTLIPYSGILKEEFVKMCGEVSATINRLIKLGWITKKGNIICLHQTVSDLLYRLDRTTPDWEKIDDFIKSYIPLFEKLIIRQCYPGDDEMLLYDKEYEECENYYIIEWQINEIIFVTGRIRGTTSACGELFLKLLSIVKMRCLCNDISDYDTIGYVKYIKDAKICETVFLKFKPKYKILILNSLYDLCKPVLIGVPEVEIKRDRGFKNKIFEYLYEVCLNEHIDYYYEPEIISSYIKLLHSIVYAENVYASDLEKAEKMLTFILEAEGVDNVQKVDLCFLLDKIGRYYKPRRYNMEKTVCGYAEYYYSQGHCCQLRFFSSKEMYGLAKKLFLKISSYYYEMEDFHLSIKYETKALLCDRKIYGKYNRDVAESYKKLAHLCCKNGRYNRAEKCYLASSIIYKCIDDTVFNRSNVLFELIKNVYIKTEKFNKAVNLFWKLEENIFENEGGFGHFPKISHSDKSIVLNAYEGYLNRVYDSFYFDFTNSSIFDNFIECGNALYGTLSDLEYFHLKCLMLREEQLKNDYKCEHYTRLIKFYLWKGCFNEGLYWITYIYKLIVKNDLNTKFLSRISSICENWASMYESKKAIKLYLNALFFKITYFKSSILKCTEEKSEIERLIDKLLSLYSSSGDILKMKEVENCIKKDDYSILFDKNSFSEYDGWNCVKEVEVCNPLICDETETCQIISDGHIIDVDNSHNRVIYRYKINERNNRFIHSSDIENEKLWQTVENITSDFPETIFEDELERVISDNHEIVTDENGREKILFHYIRQTRQHK